jgi:hypothetical protein
MVYLDEEEVYLPDIDEELRRTIIRRWTMAKD